MTPAVARSVEAISSAYLSRALLPHAPASRTSCPLLPVGALFGYGLSAAIATTVQSEVYRFPLYVSRQASASSFLGIIAAALISGLLVRRRLDRLDLVAVLKVRE